MALCVSIVASKGGAGKSTLATNLARAIQLDGNSVVLIDTDPQGTAADWSARQPEGYGLPVLHVRSAETLEMELARLTRDYDVTVVDGSAKMERGLGTCIKVADAVLVPVQPTPPDVWGAGEVVAVLRRTHRPAAFVISRQIVGTKLASEVAEGLAEYGLTVFEARTSQRVAYAEAMFTGQTVLDLADEKAVAEVQGIASELAGLLRTHNDSL